MKFYAAFALIIAALTSVAMGGGMYGEGDSGFPGGNEDGEDFHEQASRATSLKTLSEDQLRDDVIFLDLHSQPLSFSHAQKADEIKAKGHRLNRVVAFPRLDLTAFYPSAAEDQAVFDDLVHYVENLAPPFMMDYVLVLLQWEWRLLHIAWRRGDMTMGLQKRMQVLKHMTEFFPEVAGWSKRFISRVVEDYAFAHYPQLMTEGSMERGRPGTYLHVLHTVNLAFELCPPPSLIGCNQLFTESEEDIVAYSHFRLKASSIAHSGAVQKLSSTSENSSSANSNGDNAISYHLVWSCKAYADTALALANFLLASSVPYLNFENEAQADEALVLLENVLVSVSTVRMERSSSMLVAFLLEHCRQRGFIQDFVVLLSLRSPLVLRDAFRFIVEFFHPDVLDSSSSASTSVYSLLSDVYFALPTSSMRNDFILELLTLTSLAKNGLDERQSPGDPIPVLAISYGLQCFLYANVQSNAAAIFRINFDISPFPIEAMFGISDARSDWTHRSPLFNASGNIGPFILSLFSNGERFVQSLQPAFVESFAQRSLLHLTTMMQDLEHVEALSLSALAPLVSGDASIDLLVELSMAMHRYQRVNAQLHERIVQFFKEPALISATAMEASIVAKAYCLYNSNGPPECPRPPRLDILDAFVMVPLLSLTSAECLHVCQSCLNFDPPKRPSLAPAWMHTPDGPENDAILATAAPLAARRFIQLTILNVRAELLKERQLLGFIDRETLQLNHQAYKNSQSPCAKVENDATSPSSSSSSSQSKAIALNQFVVAKCPCGKCVTTAKKRDYGSFVVHSVKNLLRNYYSSCLCSLNQAKILQEYFIETSAALSVNVAPLNLLRDWHLTIMAHSSSPVSMMALWRTLKGTSRLKKTLKREIGTFIPLKYQHQLYPCFLKVKSEEPPSSLLSNPVLMVMLNTVQAKLVTEEFLERSGYTSSYNLNVDMSTFGQLLDWNQKVFLRHHGLKLILDGPHHVRPLAILRYLCLHPTALDLHNLGSYPYVISMGAARSFSPVSNLPSGAHTFENDPKELSLDAITKTADWDLWRLASSYVRQIVRDGLLSLDSTLDFLRGPLSGQLSSEKASQFHRLFRRYLRSVLPGVQLTQFMDPNWLIKLCRHACRQDIGNAYGSSYNEADLVRIIAEAPAADAHSRIKAYMKNKVEAKKSDSFSKVHALPPAKAEGVKNVNSNGKRRLKEATKRPQGFSPASAAVAALASSVSLQNPNYASALPPNFTTPASKHDDLIVNADCDLSLKQFFTFDSHGRAKLMGSHSYQNLPTSLRTALQAGGPGLDFCLHPNDLKRAHPPADYWKPHSKRSLLASSLSNVLENQLTVEERGKFCSLILYSSPKGRDHAENIDLGMNIKVGKPSSASPLLGIDNGAVHLGAKSVKELLDDPSEVAALLRRLISDPQGSFGDPSTNAVILDDSSTFKGSDDKRTGSKKSDKGKDVKTPPIGKPKHVKESKLIQPPTSATQIVRAPKLPTSAPEPKAKSTVNVETVANGGFEFIPASSPASNSSTPSNPAKHDSNNSAPSAALQKRQPASSPSTSSSSSSSDSSPTVKKGQLSASAAVFVPFSSISYPVPIHPISNAINYQPVVEWKLLALKNRPFPVLKRGVPYPLMAPLNQLLWFQPLTQINAANWTSWLHSAHFQALLSSSDVVAFDAEFTGVFLGNDVPTAESNTLEQLLDRIEYNDIYQVGLASHVGWGASIDACPDVDLHVTSADNVKGLLCSAPSSAMVDASDYMRRRLPLHHPNVRDVFRQLLLNKTVIFHNGVFDALHLLKWLSPAVSTSSWARSLRALNGNIYRLNDEIGRLLREHLGIQSFYDTRYVYEQLKTTTPLKEHAITNSRLITLVKAILNLDADPAELHTAGYDAMLTARLFSRMQHLSPQAVASCVDRLFLDEEQFLQQ